MIKEIGNALLEADVNVKLVAGLRKSIRSTVSFKELGPGVNKKRIIQKVRFPSACGLRSWGVLNVGDFKAVFDELCRLVDSHSEAYKPKKGKANIIMFVGLQGSGKTTSCTKVSWNVHRAVLEA